MATDALHTNCCIAGGGPAGMMLGYLLARAGVPVMVLEKHRDFLRDFRGDTVHPSTLEVMHELGLLEQFLTLPHQEMTSIGAMFGDFPFTAANLKYLPTRCKFVALMPQWDFLNFLASQAMKFPAFTLRLEHQVTGLLCEGRQVQGVEVRTPEGNRQIRADLIVGCDGRHSVTRKAAELPQQELGVPIDVLWFHLPRDGGEPDQALGNLNFGKALVLINRGEYFQAGLIIRKGSFETVQQQGLDAFRQSLREIAPFLGERVGTLQAWDQIKLLTVQINRLQQWYRPGLLCIGDAAHAMSPAGGVGINLAIQDAVAAANLLAEPLRERRVTEADLAAVQRRREFPTRVTQRIQVNAHKGIEYVFAHPGPLRAPWQLKLVTRIPGVPHLVGRALGLGVRPEHVRLDWQTGKQKKTPGWLTRLAVSAGAAAGAAMLASRALRTAR